jgi:hypothetical protein
MNKLIGILLIAGALWGLWALRDYYLETKRANTGAYGNSEDQSDGPAPFDPRSLSGLLYTLETPLSNAKQSGADGLKKFINQYRAAIHDPRLAWIQLDYVVLVATRDPAEARAVFAEVKKRTPTNSPVYPRIEKLSKVYE